MEVVIDAQLELENLVRDVETSRPAFTRPDELIHALKSMEKYLSELIKEYETVRQLLQVGTPTEELKSLPRLSDFLAPARESDFMDWMIVPHRVILQLIRGDLLHPQLPEPSAGKAG
jgi:hypothetical protein